MAFTATVLNVLIASPSDIPNEREAIAQTLYEWNALHAQQTGFVLLPVRWESHSAPAMGDRPQGIINDQVVRNCDLLIGAFWTRLGSPTGVAESGTVEEIKLFLKNHKPVMLYYSRAPVDPENTDFSQLQMLQEFKNSIRNKGIQESYSTLDELRQKLSRQLTIVMRGMSVETSVDARAVREANAAASSDVKDDEGQSAPEKVRLEEYTEKSFVVRGDTKRFKQELSDAGGKWMRTRDGAFAWMFSKRRLDEVSKIIGVRPKLHP